MKNAKIVVLDDQTENVDLIKEVLANSNCDVYAYSDPARALEGMDTHGVNILFSDLEMPGMDGFRVLELVRKRFPTCSVVIFTGYGDVELAVRAIKAGATDFLTKPLNYRAIPGMVKQLLELQAPPAPPPSPASKAEALFTNSSECPDNLSTMIAACAPTNCAILITGESGTGKEVLADFIQANSPRREQPYIKVNCAGLSESLIESELFGHEQGAFTGANKRHTGRFERAHSGTLFLDEIGELSMPMQTKLLRVLQNYEIERVGGSAPLKVDFRLICATHRNLEKMISEGTFRQDLYFRINTFPIHLPALRERSHEIPALAENFLRRALTKVVRGPTSISTEAMNLLQSYAWPGNIRELEHCIERACLVARDSVLRPGDLWWLQTGQTQRLGSSTLLPPLQITTQVATPAPVDQPDPTKAKLSPLENAECEALMQTLTQTHWNFTLAANQLGISRSTLYLKARKYGITRNVTYLRA